MASRMLRAEPRLARWNETGDVIQGMAIRLMRALEKVTPDSVRAFVGLAATQIRRHLLDLARHHYGPEGDARHRHSGPGPADSKGRARFPHEDAADPHSGPLTQLQWQELHERARALPGEEREVFQLLYYQGLPQEEVARLLGISESTVKRRYREARLRLHDALHGRPPSR
jgi:RNA polymerase sigma-70 factor (ECF subfamily)